MTYRCVMCDMPMLEWKEENLTTKARCVHGNCVMSDYWIPTVALERYSQSKWFMANEQLPEYDDSIPHQYCNVIPKDGKDFVIGAYFWCEVKYMDYLIYDSVYFDFNSGTWVAYDDYEREFEPNVIQWTYLPKPR